MRDARSKIGKVAVVTGAGRGIGHAHAHRLAREGATVIAVDRLPAPGLDAALRDSGAADADFHQLEVTDADAVGDLSEAVLSKYGRCDILVNNAGTTKLQSFLDITIADLRWMMAVNLESVYLTCRAFLPRMVEHGYGRIVNTASTTFALAVPGHPHYIASKGAVVGLTRGLASEFGAFGITANCIAPGLTRTPITSELFSEGFDATAQAQSIKRVGVPDDLVGAMSFLTSDDAAFITGQTIIVDGGLTRAM